VCEVNWCDLIWNLSQTVNIETNGHVIHLLLCDLFEIDRAGWDILISRHCYPKCWRD
jgi:hypothetical protein